MGVLCRLIHPRNNGDDIMRFDLRRTIIFILCWMLISSVFRWIAGFLGLGMGGYILLIGVALVIVFKFNRIRIFYWRLKNRFIGRRSYGSSYIGVVEKHFCVVCLFPYLGRIFRYLIYLICATTFPNPRPISQP